MIVYGFNADILALYRGNCEAIPEEFSGQGTTPPKTGFVSIVPDVKAEIYPDESSHMPYTGEKSPGPKTMPPKLPSFSYDDDVLKAEEKKMENRFFDKHSLPNDHFEFSRSASVSQVGFISIEYFNFLNLR